jgi:hypothetical protein
MPLSACGCEKFQLDAIGDHFFTCTTNSGAKKAHDWEADHITDLFHRTHKVKTQQVAKWLGAGVSDVGRSLTLVLMDTDITRMT